MKLLSILLVLLIIFIVKVTSVLAQDGQLGGSSGGSEFSQSNTQASGDWADFSGSDLSSGNNSIDDYSDTSGGSNFSDFVSDILSSGISGELSSITNPTGPGTGLSNQIVTLDQNGVTASYDIQNDPCLQTGWCPHPPPVLNATASCMGNQPIVNLSWSGVPQPTSQNGGLGSYTFLIRSPQLQTAIPINGVMRVFPFAAMGYGNNSYTDMYREYWNSGYSTPGWTEVTSTDENGTPTGFTEHPAINHPPVKVLTQVVNPYTFYYYRVYSTNASGAQVYRSDIQGMTYDFSYTARTPVSNIMAVYTPGCGAQTSNISVGSNVCNGSGSDVRLNFTSNASDVQNYHLDKNGQYAGSTTPSTPYMMVQLAQGETANYSMRYQTSGGTYPGSNSVSVSANSCNNQSQPTSAPTSVLAPTPIPTPAVSLSLTTPRGNFNAGGIPATVDQNEDVTIHWSLQNTESANASSDPSHPSWNGAKDPNSGSHQISTSTIGTYVFTLTGTNAGGSTSVSVQLNITPVKKPFIQTTGGDIHTNEKIYISPE